MSIEALTVQLLKALAADSNVNYEPYNLRDTQVFYAIPPIPITGIDTIRAHYTAPQTRMIPSLVGGGIHVDNINTSGYVELGMMAGSVSGGAIQVMAAMKQPFPIIIEDGKSGGSGTVVATECRLGVTPPFRREALPGIDLYTFTAAKIAIVPGMRLLSDN
jgi:hypothetical protein